MGIDITPWPSRTGPEAEAFRVRCQEILCLLVAVPTDFFARRLGDPRFMHRKLYLDKLDVARQHLAGNFRGSDHPDLKTWTVAYAFTENDGTTDLAAPHDVQAHMSNYAKAIAAFIQSNAGSSKDTLVAAAGIIGYFGFIHPFWDGNGHVQRITFEALLRFKGIELNADWSVHPCPYDVDTHRAFASRDPTRIADRLRCFL